MLIIIGLVVFRILIQMLRPKGKIRVLKVAVILCVVSFSVLAYIIGAVIVREGWTLMTTDNLIFLFFLFPLVLIFVLLWQIRTIKKEDQMTGT